MHSPLSIIPSLPFRRTVKAGRKWKRVEMWWEERRGGVSRELFSTPLHGCTGQQNMLSNQLPGSNRNYYRGSQKYYVLRRYSIHPWTMACNGDLVRWCVRVCSSKLTVDSMLPSTQAKQRHMQLSYRGWPHPHCLLSVAHVTGLHQFTNHDLEALWRRQLIRARTEETTILKTEQNKQLSSSVCDV